MINTQDSLRADPAVIIDAAHYDRLYNMAISTLQRVPLVAERLLDEISRAEIRQSDKVPAHTINLGSRVTYRDETVGMVHTICLVWPFEANIETQRISVLTPIGTTLIGLSQGESIHWETNNGERRRLTILHVEPANSL